MTASPKVSGNSSTSRPTTLASLRHVFAGALAHLESRRQEINDMNVFPVADGDTGDNMVNTMRAVIDELDRVEAEINGHAWEEFDRTEIVRTVARAALLGARGNSGVILSQIVRGAAEELAQRSGELIGPAVISATFAGATDAAYSAVREPAEGTMLTVIREMAHRVARDVSRSPHPRLAKSVSSTEQYGILVDVLQGAVEAGKESVNRGPEFLPVLAETGVLDAGGVGVVTLMEGAVAALRGEEPPEEQARPIVARPGTPHDPESRYRYCTNLVVSNCMITRGQLSHELRIHGDSTLVVGDAAVMRVHIHTDEPAVAVNLCKRWGAVSRVEVADMRAQSAEREKRLMGWRRAPRAVRHRCVAVAVAAGDGVRSLYEGLGAIVVDGGDTLNPSTEELLAAIASAPADEVVVLPNSSNVILAASQAAEFAEKPVSVVKSRSQQAGLACVVELSQDAGAEDNAALLGEVLETIRTAGVAPAARDDRQGRFRRGDAVGFVGEEMVAWGEPAEVLDTVLAQLADGSEIVTCLVGDDAPLSNRDVYAHVPDRVELEIHRGGQPSYWWLLTAE